MKTFKVHDYVSVPVIHVDGKEMSIFHTKGPCCGLGIRLSCESFEKIAKWFLKSKEPKKRKVSRKQFDKDISAGYRLVANRIKAEKSGRIGESYLSVGKKVKGIKKTITLISSERYRKHK